MSLLLKMRRVTLQKDNSEWHSVMLPELRDVVYDLLDIISLRAMACSCVHEYVKTFEQRFLRLGEAPKINYVTCTTFTEFWKKGIRHRGRLMSVAPYSKKLGRVHYSKLMHDIYAYVAVDREACFRLVHTQFPGYKLTPCISWDGEIKSAIEQGRLSNIRYYMETLGLRVTRHALPKVRKPRDPAAATANATRVECYDYVAKRALNEIDSLNDYKYDYWQKTW